MGDSQVPLPGFEAAGSSPGLKDVEAAVPEAPNA